jgi:hypothetical protein
MAALRFVTYLFAVIVNVVTRLSRGRQGFGSRLGAAILLCRQHFQTGPQPPIQCVRKTEHPLLLGYFRVKESKYKD